MARDDDILLGTEIMVDRDSDGDGVGDMQERSDGTDPTDASDLLRPDPTREPSRSDDDPRGVLNPETLEREVAFDPTAAIPEGMTVDVGLAGLTDLAGDALKSSPDHGGVGEFDAALDGRVGGTSPLDMLRDPTGSGADDTSGASVPPFGSGPSGLSSPTGDHVGWSLEGAANSVGRAVGAVIDAQADYSAMAGRMFDAYRQGVTEPREPPPPPPPDPPPPPPDPPKTTSTDPDAVGGGAPTVEEIERAIALTGSDTKPVDGADVGPHPIDTGDLAGRLDPIINPNPDGDGSDGTTTTAPRVTTAGPDVINPDSGFAPRPSGGSPPPSGGGGGEDWLTGASSAATASSATVAPDLSVVGAGGGGGIQSVDTGAAAVDTFATQFLADAPAPTVLADPLTPSLAADLGADPLASVDAVAITIPDIGHSDVADVGPATDLFGNDDAIGG